jgi:hypothetical protein
MSIILPVTDQSFALTTRCMDEKRFYHLCLCWKLLLRKGQKTDNPHCILSSEGIGRWTRDKYEDYKIQLLVITSKLNSKGAARRIDLPIYHNRYSNS